MAHQYFEINFVSSVHDEGLVFCGIVALMKNQLRLGNDLIQCQVRVHIY